MFQQGFSLRFQRGFLLGFFGKLVLLRCFRQLGVIQQIGDHGVLKGIHRFQIREKAAPLGGGEGIQREVVGNAGGNGQIVLPDQSLVLTQLQQPQDSLVGILVLIQQIRVEGQRVHGGVGYQRAALAVGDDAAGFCALTVIL